MKQPTKPLPNPGVPVWLACILLLGLTWIVYLPLTKAGFIWDDSSMVNAFVKAKNGLSYIWFSTQLPDYFPLTSTSLWIEWRLWGDHPLGYHITNLLLHTLSVLVLWRVLVRLNIPGAFLGALLFAVHPVNVESVAWIAERKNTLSLLFYGLSMLCFLKSLAEPRQSVSAPATASPRTALFYWLSLALFVLSLLSKTSGVMLPFVLLLCVWWRNGKISRQDIVRTIPFFGLALVLGLITVWFQYHRAIGSDLFAHRTFGERVASAGLAVWFYLGKAIWPSNLSFVYPAWTIKAGSLLSYLPLVILVAAFIALGRSRRRHARPVFFALLYFVLMLLPVLGFLNIYFQRYALVADHWQYFALIGVTASVGALLAALQNSLGRVVTIGMAVAIIAALSVQTWRYCHIYQDEETLWRDTLAKNPGSWLAQNNWGLLLEARGQSDEAITHYQQSLQTQPMQTEAYNNLGAVYLEKADLKAAMEQFQDALRRDPNAAVTHYNVGNTLDRQGKDSEALAEYNEALRLDPFYVDAHNNIACMLALHGKLPESIERFRRVLELNPDHLQALGNLGSTLVEQGKPADGLPYLRHAIALKPDFADAHYNLGNALLALNKPSDAATEYTLAVKSNPKMALAHYKLGNLALQSGKPNDAVEQYVEALRLQPSLAEAHYQLSLLLQAGGRLADAVAHLKVAVQLKPDWLEALNNLAWVYATSPNALHRDGDEAVRLAKHAADLTQSKDPAVLDTLAAAYAQNRDFPEAIATAQQASELARAAHATGLVVQINMRLASYKGGKPFRDETK